MSQLVSEQLDCPRCGARFHVSIGRSLNVERAPHARSAALAGRLHCFACPECESPHRVETTFGYMDVPSKHWLAVFPPHEVSKWTVHEAASHAAFWEVSDRSPMRWNFHAMAMTVRCVFGLADLREKLLIWQAGLDDAVIEVWKIELEAAESTLKAGALRFEGLDESNDGEVAIFTTGDALPPPKLAAPRARYRVLKAARPALAQRYPALFAGPFVDRRRL